jgi:hypothetical protein
VYVIAVHIAFFGTLIGHLITRVLSCVFTVRDAYSLFSPTTFRARSAISGFIAIPAFRLTHRSHITLRLIFILASLSLFVRRVTVSDVCTRAG